jgi:hypothetical protein
MNIYARATLAALALVGGAAITSAHATITPVTSGLTTTYAEDFEGGQSFVGGFRVEAGSDDYLSLNALAPSASYSFFAPTALAALDLSFWYSVPGAGSGTVTLASTTLNLPDTPGNAAQFLFNNPGESAGGPFNANDFDDRFHTTFSNLAAGTYTLTFSRLGGLFAPNALRVDDVILSVTAVPEPETYALMLAGLGIVGFVARRRRPDRG